MKMNMPATSLLKADRKAFRGECVPATVNRLARTRSCLLVVLAIEETRNVERLATEGRHRLVTLSLRLGGAAGDVRHALEQSAAVARDLAWVLAAGVSSAGVSSSISSSAGGAIGAAPTGWVKMSSLSSTSSSVSSSVPSSSGSASLVTFSWAPDSAAGATASVGRLVLRPGKLNTLPGCGAAEASASMPVATTDTRILPSRSLLNAEPQMMLASGSTNSLMWLAASSTSIRRMSSPPVIEMMTPLAPFMLTPSSSGFRSPSRPPRWRGSRRRLAGAHHRLAHLTHHRADIGEVEIDEARHDHQIGDATDALLEDLVRHFERFLEGRFRIGEAEQILVGNDDNVSTCCCSSLMPASAERERRAPSKANGLVTTPTVKMPLSRASLAMTGAAPVPVPPPMPAAMKHICAPSSARSISSIVSSRRPADLRPRAGAEPLGDLQAQLDAAVGGRRRSRPGRRCWRR